MPIQRYTLAELIVGIDPELRADAPLETVEKRSREAAEYARSKVLIRDFDNTVDGYEKFKYAILKCGVEKLRELLRKL